jgi:hypothetical protein
MRLVRFVLVPLPALAVALVFVTGCPDESSPGGAPAPSATTPPAPAPDASGETVDAAGSGVVDSGKPDVVEAGPGPGGTTDASFPGDGCADGTREGLVGASYPNIALCAGVWSGPVSRATFLCEGGWHVCNGQEAAMKSVTYDDGTAFPGCYAFDAAHDNYACHPGCDKAVEAGVDTYANIDMGGLGRDCPYKFPSGGSCINSGRIDSSENSGTGCDYKPSLTGLVCCRDGT